MKDQVARLQGQAGRVSVEKPMQTNDRTSKNGIESTTTEPGSEITVATAGGVLVYEKRQLGKELVGFRAVTDWDDLADALRARGHDHGAIHHLPELDQ